jgi:hypothetical protein
MDPISNADRLVLLLRHKLQERSKAAGRPGAPTKSTVDVPTGIAGVTAQAAIEGADERPLRRALIQHLLADQLGPSLINDAQFQQTVSRVTESIEEDPRACELLSRLVNELRSS